MTAPATVAALAVSVPDLVFAVEHAEPLHYAVAPTIAFRLRVESRGGEAIRSLSLTTQIRIAATARGYDEREQAGLLELFGEPRRWGQTLRSLLWAHATITVPAFEGATSIELPVSCTYDFDVASAKYFHALQHGEVPLEFLFSGTVFYAGAGGALRTARIGWDQEAAYRMPVAVWRETMDHYFPGSAWLRLRTDTFERLHAFRGRAALPSWEAAIEALLDREEPAP